ncbi:hypothetical protein D3C75_1234440 [compost metagenome]
MGVSGLGLLSAQLQDVCPYRFFDEARQVALTAAALAGQKHPKRLVGVGRDGDIPANGIHSVLR